jgi:hypothetical protein
MNRFFIYVAALAMSAAMLAPQGLSAQQRVIKVQGHPHEYLTKKLGSKDAKMKRTIVSTQLGDTTYINPASIPCWINEARLNTATQIDTAYLIIKWTDGKAIDSVFVWGYRFNGTSPHHGIDMLRTVANNDRRLSILLQYAGVFGHSVGGIGLNWNSSGADCSRVTINFNLIGAQTEGYVNFIYSGDTICARGYGQVTVPTDVNGDISRARTNYNSTGILVHPFGIEYGYPAYDFDYWTLGGLSQNVRHWQAGWIKNGFWNYYRADSLRVPIPNTDWSNDPDASQLGITYEPLLNRQVHGFVFEPDFTVHQFGGNIRFMNCGCAPCPEYVTPVNVERRKK